MNDMVATNIGLIPKEDYLDIMAMQYGFESYEDLKKSGFKIGDDYNMVGGSLFLEERLTDVEKNNLYDECEGCLNRICITDDKEEVLTMLASLQVKAMLLGKDTFMRIDEKQNKEIIHEPLKVR